MTSCFYAMQLYISIHLAKDIYVQIRHIYNPGQMVFQIIFYKKLSYSFVVAAISHIISLA